MSIKPHINSLRCKKWYGFAKTKILQLKNYDIPGKTYIINGYRIVLKALTDLALIKAPAGLAIFRKAPGEIQIYYADMYGNGKEKPYKALSLRDAFGGKPLNPMDDGWPGNILPLALGGFDFIQLFFGARPENLVDNPSYFTYRSSISTRALAVADGAIQFNAGFFNQVSGVALPHVFSVCAIDDWYIFGIYGECRSPDYGFPALYLGAGKNRPGSLFYLDFPYDIPVGWLPDSSTWSREYCQYMYVWKHFNATSNRNVARVMCIIQGVRPGFNYDDCFFLFLEIDPVAETIYYWGYTDAEDLETLSPDMPVTLGGRVLGYWFIGAPETQASEKHGYKNIIFPIANGQIGIANYSNAKTVMFAVTDNNNPYLLTGLTFPYVWDEFTHPFCVRTVEGSPSLYLYWEEAMRYGDGTGEETDIVNLKYGSPYASWVAFPFFDEGVKLTNFIPIKVTWEHKILLATIYKELDPQDGGGMYTALLDTEKSSDWIIGQRFSETRLDRCSPTVFGEHPYVEERKKYGGTQWGWDYSYCRNYEEPPGGYPT
jgi:hypothetical protein